MKRALVLVIAACGSSDSDRGRPDAAVEADPLAVPGTTPAGSLDDLHARVIVKRCSGQPGLCHNGQFEPNLSTPGLTYANLVNRPSIEKPRQLRVAPGQASASLFIDKIRNRGVATQMPLGADPLSEEDTRALEAWIDAGALRSPGAAPAPLLNNPPRRPQIGVFSTTNTRLDTSGPVDVSPGTTVVLRHTVSDFETADNAVPFGAVVLSISDGRSIILTTSANPEVGPTSFDAAGPPAQGDTFNYKRNWTVPAQLQVQDEAGAVSTVPASGQTISVLALYLDGAPMMGGMLALEQRANVLRIP